MAGKLIIFGGTGFVGRYIAREALAAGWQVTLAARQAASSPVPGADIIASDILVEDDVARALEGMTGVVNCVGILAPNGANTFEALQFGGADRIARLAAQAAIPQMVQVSAIGADAASPSVYQQTKGRAEAAVLKHMPDAIILRPSIVFGPEDSFFNRFADLSRLSPFVPVVGAGTRFAPVYVGDVARAAVAALARGEGGIFELGGPDTESFSALMERMLAALGRRRLILPLPAPVGSLMGTGFELLSKLSGGKIEPQITRDQVKNLANDNVPTGHHPGLSDLGIDATSMAAILPSYLKP